MNKQLLDNPKPLISHVSIGVCDVEKSVELYDEVMSVLGCERLIHYDEGAAYGRGGVPSFWLQIPINGEPATLGNGSHVCFAANSKETVDSFYKAALAMGGVCDGPPGFREQFSKAYYAAFFRDIDGHKIEALYWDESII